LFRMYFPRNWEFGLALSKLKHFGGGGFVPPELPPWYATVGHLVQKCSIQPLNRIEHQAYLPGGLKAAGLGRTNHVPIIHKFWEPQSPSALRAGPGMYWV
jgi:hypothetical protein